MENIQHILRGIFLAVGIIGSFHAAHAQVPDYVPTEGLVSWYSFDGNANDESGNGNDGEVVGATAHEDRFGNASSALNFANAADWVDVPTISTGSEYTIQAWALFPLPSTAHGHNTFVSDWNLGAEADLIFMTFHESCGLAIGDQYTPGNCVQGIYGVELIASDVDDGWHLVTTVVSSGQTKFYLDGILLDTIDHAISGTIEAIGNNAADQGVAPQNAGTLDDVGMWNRALSASEVLALYNAEPPGPGCTDPTACNFDAEATSDDGSCIPSGCMEPLACNYNALAECAGEACDYACCPGPGCCADGTSWDYGLGQCVPDETNDATTNSCPQDLDFDGVVGVGDLMDLLSVFGTNCPTNFTCGDPVSYHGYDYATVLIGEQCWFAENLRAGHYTNGDAIPANLSDGEWGSTTSGAVAVYGEDSGCNNYSPDGNACDPEWSLNEYGHLYNWYAVDDARGLCPAGWHVPTDGEWMTLEMALGMSESEANSTGWRGTDQGTQMKATYGRYVGGNGTNSSSFSGLPGGYRMMENGYFSSAGAYGAWWSISPSGSLAWYRSLTYNSPNVNRDYYNQNDGISVRCLRDSE